MNAANITFLSNLWLESFVHKVSRKFAAAENGQVSRKFAAAKNGKVSRKFVAAKIGQVSRQFAAAKSFVANSYRFKLVVRAIEYDDDYRKERKENFSIPHMTRLMDPNSLPAIFRFSLAMSTLENDDEYRRQNFFYLTYDPSYGPKFPASRNKMKKKS